MVAVRWSPEAETDLDNVLQYLSSSSRQYTGAFLEEIDEVVDLLRDYPFMGRHVPESKNPLDREVFVKNYRIIYRVREEENEIVILMVIHGSRLLRL